MRGGDVITSGWRLGALSAVPAGLIQLPAKCRRKGVPDNGMPAQVGAVTLMTASTGPEAGPHFRDAQSPAGSGS